MIALQTNSLFYVFIYYLFSINCDVYNLDVRLLNSSAFNLDQ